MAITKKIRPQIKKTMALLQNKKQKLDKRKQPAPPYTGKATFVGLG